MGWDGAGGFFFLFLSLPRFGGFVGSWHGIDVGWDGMFLFLGHGV